MTSDVRPDDGVETNDTNLGMTETTTRPATLTTSPQSRTSSHLPPSKPGSATRNRLSTILLNGVKALKPHTKAGTTRNNNLGEEEIKERDDEDDGSSILSTAFSSTALRNRLESPLTSPSGSVSPPWTKPRSLSPGPGSKQKMMTIRTRLGAMFQLRNSIKRRGREDTDRRYSPSREDHAVSTTAMGIDGEYMPSTVSRVRGRSLLDLLQSGSVFVEDLPDGEADAAAGNTISINNNGHNKISSNNQASLHIAALGPAFTSLTLNNDDQNDTELHLDFEDPTAFVTDKTQPSAGVDATGAAPQIEGQAPGRRHITSTLTGTTLQLFASTGRDAEKPTASSAPDDGDGEHAAPDPLIKEQPHHNNTASSPRPRASSSPLTLRPQPSPSSSSERHSREETGDSECRTPDMISHHHQSPPGTSTLPPHDGFPPYPYAHLYPQQPQASSSRPNVRLPHSHHGHGSSSPTLGSDLAYETRPRAMSPPPISGSQQRKWEQMQRGAAATGQGQTQGQAAAKANLKAWWSHFNFVRGLKKDAVNPATSEFGSYRGPANAGPQGVVFGKPLKESLKYASVQISTANSNGELYVWGYIPVVVAKCGLYLKENATEVPGTFRVNGSSKRMRILQETFETPPRYGKNLDWKQEQYTTHDVASVFRRYLTQMPEPVIPYDLYHQFRDVLAKEPYNQEEVIAKYKSLMRQMPRANQYLLLYVLDLLSVFARKSDINLMTATNLAVIFRPGLISHPNHEMSPPEHALSQKVLEFLIAHQDWFMLDIPPPPGRRGSAQQQAQGQPTSHLQGQSPYLSAPQPSPLPSTPPTAATAGHGHSFAQQQQQPQQQQKVSAFVGHSNGFGHASGSSSSATHPHHQASSSTSPPRQTRSNSHSRFGTSSARPLSDMGSDVDDVMVIPGGVLEEHEEFSSGVGGGWRLLSKTSREKEKEKERVGKMMRRRTTLERSELQGGALDEGESGSPTTEPETPTITNSTNQSGVTVQRSRTLPSSRRKDNSNDIHGSSTGELVLSSSTGTGTNAGKENNNNLLGSSAFSKEGKERKGMLLKKNRRISSNNVGGEKEKERT